jgi:hypothetical protein
MLYVPSPEVQDPAASVVAKDVDYSPALFVAPHRDVEHMTPLGQRSIMVGE